MPNPATPDVYSELMTAIVQRFITLMGPPALRLARRQYGLHIADNGQVTDYRGDATMLIQGLVLEYMTLLGPEVVTLSRRAIQTTLDRNPSLKLPSILQ